MDHMNKTTLTTIKTDEKVFAVSSNSDSTFFVAGGPGFVSKYGFPSCNLLTTISTDFTCFRCEVSSDDEELYLKTDMGLRILSAKTLEETGAFLKGERIYSQAYLKRSEQVWLGLASGQLRVLNTRTKTICAPKTQHGFVVTSLSVCVADSAVFSSAQDNRLYKWDAKTKKVTIKLELPDSPLCHCVSFDQQSLFLVVVSEPLAEFRVSDLSLLRTYARPTSSPVCCMISPASEQLIVSFSDGTVRFFLGSAPPLYFNDYCGQIAVIQHEFLIVASHSAGIVISELPQKQSLFAKLDILAAQLDLSEDPPASTENLRGDFLRLLRKIRDGEFKMST